MSDTYLILIFVAYFVCGLITLAVCATVERDFIRNEPLIMPIIVLVWPLFAASSLIPILIAWIASHVKARAA